MDLKYKEQLEGMECGRNNLNISSVANAFGILSVINASPIFYPYSTTLRMEPLIWFSG
jgi:hypothetical protein